MTTRTSLGTTLAPEGQVYICGACGKTSPTRYGFDDNNTNVGDPGWDASCMMNATLCTTDSIRRNEAGRVTHADPVAMVTGSEGGGGE